VAEGSSSVRGATVVYSDDGSVGAQQWSTTTVVAHHAVAASRMVVTKNYVDGTKSSCEEEK